MGNNHENNTNVLVIGKTAAIFAVSAVLLFFLIQIEEIKNVLSWITGMVSPVFIGVIFAYILNPIFSRVEKLCLRCFKKARIKNSLSRGISVVVSIFVLLLFIAFLIFLIIPEFLESLSKLILIAPALIDKAVLWLSPHLSDDSIFMQNFGEALTTLTTKLTEWIGGELSSIIGNLLEGAISVVSFLFDFIVTLVVCVYALLEKERFVAQSKKMIFALCSPQRANDILSVARFGNAVMGQFILGKLITSMIVGILTFLFMTIMNMPYALLSAGIIAITNIIPFFGPFIGGIPTAFIVLLTDFRLGVIYVIFMLVLQQIEGNVIEPMIMEDKTGVSKFWIIFAILLCGGLFGLTGMIFSVPLFATLFYCIRLTVDRNLNKKELPVHSEEYLSVVEIDSDTKEFKYASEETHKKRFRLSLRGIFPHLEQEETPEATAETSEQNEKE